MAAPTVDFGFLFQDVKRQRELAQQALDEAKRIDELLKNPEIANREHLEEARRKWLEMARALAENANTTSSSGSTTISTIVSTSSTR
jgi:Skp family chaperone for outer membrane proteins